jgi:high-affinity nickel-transport protein
VSTIVSRARSTRSALRIGALWGLGHTVTLLSVGSAIIFFGVVIPPRLGLSLELSVALMLIALGIFNMRKAAHDSSKGDASTADLTAPLPARPLFVGLVHGLAGSAAMALIVLTTIREPGQAMLYLTVLALGTVLGMVALTGTLAIPLLAATTRFQLLDRVLGRVMGTVSIAFGLFLVYRIGFVDGLFLSSSGAIH